MMKFLHIAILSLVLLAGTHKISSVETSGSWIYLYDESGHRYKTLSTSSVGEGAIVLIFSFRKTAAGSICTTAKASATRHSAPRPLVK